MLDPSRTCVLRCSSLWTINNAVFFKPWVRWLRWPGLSHDRTVLVIKFAPKLSQRMPFRCHFWWSSVKQRHPERDDSQKEAFKAGERQTYARAEMNNVIEWNICHHVLGTAGRLLSPSLFFCWYLVFLVLNKTAWPYPQNSHFRFRNVANPKWSRITTELFKDSKFQSVLIYIDPILWNKAFHEGTTRNKEDQNKPRGNNLADELWKVWSNRNTNQQLYEHIYIYIYTYIIYNRI